MAELEELRERAKERAAQLKVLSKEEKRKKDYSAMDILNESVIVIERLVEATEQLEKELWT